MVEYRGVTTPPHWNAADSRYQSTIDCQFLQAGAGCIKAYHLQITIPLVLVGVRQSKSDSQITRSKDNQPMLFDDGIHSQSYPCCLRKSG